MNCQNSWLPHNPKAPFILFGASGTTPPPKKRKKKSEKQKNITFIFGPRQNRRIFHFWAKTKPVREGSEAPFIFSVPPSCPTGKRPPPTRPVNRDASSFGGLRAKSRSEASTPAALSARRCGASPAKWRPLGKIYDASSCRNEYCLFSLGFERSLSLLDLLFFQETNPGVLAKWKDAWEF